MATPARHRWREVGSLAVGCVFALLSATARADVQTTAGLTIGLAGQGASREVWDATAFHLGLHGDALFGRSRRTDFGAGPYLEALTHGFDEVQVGTGFSLLVPVPELPVVVSGGGYLRSGPDPYGVEPGVAAQLFFGSRSYNFHAPYGLTAGLVAQFRYGLGDLRETAVVIAAQIDLQVLALPFVYLAGSLKGGSPDVAPVEPEITSRR